MASKEYTIHKVWATSLVICVVAICIMVVGMAEFRRERPILVTPEYPMLRVLDQVRMDTMLGSASKTELYLAVINKIGEGLSDEEIQLFKDQYLPQKELE